ncbi:hypothetical protein IV203_010952 [Nitzschia inconspicua]|uniref:Uncharacterized protein n=1 Tax=Nitzschia inconspicua TaxID=303405 RepID=A0A9K3KY43_9STRA|nr:hypothetical protein IV203_010952 [Nitzschia inconspicua]
MMPCTRKQLFVLSPLHLFSNFTGLEFLESVFPKRRQNWRQSGDKVETVCLLSQDILSLSQDILSLSRDILSLSQVLSPIGDKGKLPQNILSKVPE